MFSSQSSNGAQPRPGSSASASSANRSSAARRVGAGMENGRAGAVRGSWAVVADLAQRVNAWGASAAQLPKVVALDNNRVNLLALLRIHATTVTPDAGTPAGAEAHHGPACAAGGAKARGADGARQVRHAAAVPRLRPTRRGARH